MKNVAAGGAVSLTYLGPDSLQTTGNGALAQIGTTLQSYSYAPADTAYTPVTDYKQSYEQAKANTLAAAAQNLYNNMTWEANRYHGLYVAARKNAFQYDIEPRYFGLVQTSLQNQGHYVPGIESSFFKGAMNTFASTVNGKDFQNYLANNIDQIMFDATAENVADMMLISYYSGSDSDRAKMGITPQSLASYKLSATRLAYYRSGARYSFTFFDSVPKNGDGLSDEAICVREEALIKVKAEMN